MTLTRATALFTLFLLSACSLADDIPSWLGGGDDKPPLPGTRVAVLTEADALTPDASLGDRAVTIPAAKANDQWRQAGGGTQGMTGNLQFSGYLHHDSVRIGDGNGWDQALYAAPVVANGLVFAMDAKGYISALNAGDLHAEKWSNRSLVAEDEPDILGGGLGVEEGVLYATSGRGVIAAIDASSGKERWKQTLGVPLHASPKAFNGHVYALSVDNQLFALDAAKGTLLWTHRGINENAGFLADIAPAVTDTAIIAPYSSGELHALDATTGQDLWTDNLVRAHRTSATSGFSGIGGNPVVKDDVVYAAGSSGLSAAIALGTGRRLWEQEVSALNTPWIAGDFLYVLASDNRLLCLLRDDGRVKWAVQLPRYENEEKRKNPFVWRGPIMAGDQLLVAGAHGQMLALTPADGKLIATVDIAEGITDAPIVAGGRLYFLTQDARLHMLY